MDIKSLYDVVPCVGEEKEHLKKLFPYPNIEFVRYDPGDLFMTSKFTKFDEDVFNFQFKPTDVLIVTYPKSGTNWTQEIVWTMRNNPNLDSPYDDFQIMARVPFIDGDFVIQSRGSNHPLYDHANEYLKALGQSPATSDGPQLELARRLPDPRTLKTHIPLTYFKEDLLDKCKVIYVARNPKDVCVSYYHHLKNISPFDFNGNFEDLAELFLRDKVLHSPYWPHLKSAWNKRGHRNLLWISYEEMKQEPLKEIKRLDKFLGTNLTVEQMHNVVHRTSLGFMKVKEQRVMEKISKSSSGKSVSGKSTSEPRDQFIRKGIVGDHKNMMSKELQQKFDMWTKDNTEDCNINFKYSI